MLAAASVHCGSPAELTGCEDAFGEMGVGFAGRPGGRPRFFCFNASACFSRSPFAPLPLPSLFNLFAQCGHNIKRVHRRNLGERRETTFHPGGDVRVDVHKKDSPIAQRA